MDIQIKCRYRSSPRSIDPEFDACTECIVCLSDTTDVTNNNSGVGNKNRNKRPALQITKIRRQRSFNIPPVVPKERSLSATRRRDRSRSVGRREFSVVNALGMEDDTNNNGKTLGESYSRKGSGQSTTSTVGTISAVGLEMDEEEEEEGEWVEKKKGATSPPRSLVGGSAVKTKEAGSSLPPTTPFNPKRDNSPLIREYSNLSRTPSQTRSESARSSSRSRSHSRSRSRSLVGGTPMMRKRSMGAHAAFNAFADAEIDGSRSGTPLRSRGCSVEEEPSVEILCVPLEDIVSVDQEIPSRKRHSSSAGSDFFSSAASDTGSSATALSPPKPSDSYHSKSALHRIFLHTSSSAGYIEFSFDNPNSHDIIMAFLSAHLKPNQLPRKTPNNQIIPPLDGAMQTMVLTPTTMEKRMPSILRQPPQLTRSTSTDSACTLDKLQKKIIQQRIQSETTPLERIKENVASWMSSIVDCACCQDTTVAPDPDDKSASKRGIVATAAGDDMSPASKLLKRKGIGGLSFEESSARLSPRLSFEKSVATDNSSRR